MPSLWFSRASWRLVVVLAASLLLSSLGYAAAKGLTLEDIINVAVRDNKDLRAARHIVDTARTRLLQASLPANPRKHKQAM